MMTESLSGSLLITVLLLVGLELVLGIDNILVISMIVAPLTPKLRQRARVIGLLLALLFRIGFVLTALSLAKLKTVLFLHFSARDLLLFCGGLFLILKGFNEIFTLIKDNENTSHIIPKSQRLFSIVVQIVLFDILFSIDSVITAVGLTPHFSVILISVVLSFIGLLFFIGPIGEFILKYPTLKLLALAFLVLIGASFVSESLGFLMSHQTIYSIMGFALFVEFLQSRYRKKEDKN